ncbi:MAG: pyruvate formate lyase family protein, partial [Promethearchaeota archaeon]
MVVTNYKMDLLQGIPSERVRRIRDNMLNSPFEYDLERARCYTRVWKRMENSPPCMRKAKALEEFLQKIPIRIDDDEILVGVKSSKIRADPFEIELGRHVTIFDLLLDDTLDEQTKKFIGRRAGFMERYAPLTEQELNELKNDFIPFWKGKTLKDRKIELLKEAGLYNDYSGPMARVFNAFLAGIPDTYTLLTDSQGHTIPGFKRVLKMGFKGIEKMAKQNLGKLKEYDEDYEQRKDFYESVLVVANAVCDYSNRYADLATKMAEKAN